MFKQFAISIALELVCKFLGLCLHEESCPDGVCEEAINDLQSIQRKLDSPNLKVGAVGSPLDFIKCLDLPRFLAWVKEGIAIFNDAKICNDDDNNVITLGAAPDPKAN